MECAFRTNPGRDGVPGPTRLRGIPQSGDGPLIGGQLRDWSPRAKAPRRGREPLEQRVVPYTLRIPAPGSAARHGTLCGALPRARRPLGSGDRLLLYTDGLSEAGDAAGVLLSPLALEPALQGELLPATMDAILDTVVAHATSGRLVDDLALLLLEHVGTDRRQPTRAPHRSQ